MPLQRKVSKRKVSKRKLSKRKLSKRKVSKRKTFRRKSTRVHNQKRRNTKRVKLRGGNGYDADDDDYDDYDEEQGRKKRKRSFVPPAKCEEELKTEYKEAQDLLATQVGIDSRRRNNNPTCEDNLSQLKKFNNNFRMSVQEQLAW